jgi:ribosomal protein S18 acetylase RimI-like enzyme
VKLQSKKEGIAVEIRNYRPDDLDALYRICLETGDAGKDATQIYRDPKLLGHVYAAPYGILAPEGALVAEDSEGVGGYILGPVDTRSFEKRLEADWWPALRDAYADPAAERFSSWSADERMHYLIHHPSRAPRRIAEPYPSHLHIDLLPRLQGRGHGRKLIDAWLSRMREAGSIGAHLGVGPANARAVRFYRAYGFAEIERIGPPFNVIYFGMTLR